MRNLKSDIDEAKETIEEYKDRIRKFRLAESDRLKQVKKGEMMLKIYIKQN